MWNDYMLIYEILRLIHARSALREQVVLVIVLERCWRCFSRVSVHVGVDERNGRRQVWCRDESAPENDRSWGNMEERTLI